LRAAALIAVLIASAGLAKPRPAARVPRARTTSVKPDPVVASPQGPGRVTFATATTAYVDRGTADGVKIGAGLTVTRAGRLVGRCTITAASDRWATCAVEGMKAGDKVAIDRVAEKPAAVLAAVPDAEALRAQREALEAQPLAVVEFGRGAGGLLSADRRLAAVAISHTSWFDFTAARRPFDVQRVDVGVYDVQIWRGLHASADLTVLNYSRRPGDHRTVQGGTVLLVRQLELSFHTPSVPWIAQVGRTWTRHTPGLLMVDGAQAAWRNANSSLEVGAYGGLLPEPVGLGVTTRRWGAGAYAYGRITSGSSVVQLEGRAGWASAASVPGRLELAGAVDAWLTRTFDAHLSFELGLLAATAVGFVDAARLDFGWRPSERVRVFASGRYQGTVASDVLELGVAAPGGHRAVRGEAGATVELAPPLWLAVSGGLADDLSTGLLQASFGPELTLPRLLPATALTLGYREELGWLRGRSGWAQATVTPGSRLRVLLRGGWFQQQSEPGDEGLAGHEVSGALMVDLSITRWLWLRGTVAGRGQLGSADRGDGAPANLNAMIQAGGQL